MIKITDYDEYGYEAVSDKVGDSVSYAISLDGGYYANEIIEGLDKIFDKFDYARLNGEYAFGIKQGQIFDGEVDIKNIVVKKDGKWEMLIKRPEPVNPFDPGDGSIYHTPNDDSAYY